jgi:hypothetical protein
MWYHDWLMPLMAVWINGYLLMFDAAGNFRYSESELLEGILGRLVRDETEKIYILRQSIYLPVRGGARKPG